MGICRPRQGSDAPPLVAVKRIVALLQQGRDGFGMICGLMHGTLIAHQVIAVGNRLAPVPPHRSPHAR